MLMFSIIVAQLGESYDIIVTTLCYNWKSRLCFTNPLHSFSQSVKKYFELVTEQYVGIQQWKKSLCFQEAVF